VIRVDVGDSSALLRVRAWRATARWAERRPYVFAFAAVTMVALFILPWRGTMDSAQPGMWFLLAVVGVASLAGERGAITAAVVAFALWNFVFIPPYYTFAVAEPRVWFDLVAFLIVGSAVGLQAAIRKRREGEVRTREHETALLNHLLETLVSPPPAENVPLLVLRTLADAVSPLESAVYLAQSDGRFERSWHPQPDSWPSAVEATVADTFRSLRPIGTSADTPGSSSSGAPASLMFVPLLGASRAYGVLYTALAPAVGSRLSTRRLVVSVATVLSAHLERMALQHMAIEVDALKAADDLKSGFVASVSHELKTPLASAMATVTGLLEPGADTDALSEAVRTELEAVVEDLRRLEANIVDLLDMSRLEDAAWELRLDDFEIGEVIGDVLAVMSPSARARVRLSVDADIPPVRMDFRHVARALRNLSDNALAYSPPKSSIGIGARVLGDALVVWVEDEGPGVSADEHEAVFRKFYRSAHTPRTTGSTGLGLAITREIVRRHGGSVWIEDVLPHGARFVFSLPLAMRLEQGNG
jgi:two-component system sensor histidine kinase KdpD